MSWPNDADGDVFRSLQADGFDFSAPALIDFNVEVKDPATWGDAVDAAVDAFPDAGIGEEETHFVVQISAPLTYDFVVATQKKLTDVTAAHGGKCNSWSVS